MNYKNLFYFDIETVSQYKNLEELKENDKRGYDLFIRKIERKSIRFDEWKKNPEIVYEEKSSLIPEFGKIVCVSMGFFKDEELRLKSVYSDNEEKLIHNIHDIFTKISNTTMSLCGYYIKGFDIPWLNKKFLKYNLEIPRILKTFDIKPWDMNIYDLSDIWKSYGTIENSSFDEMLYDLGIDSPKEKLSGENVNKTYWEGDLELIKDYCEDDVTGCINAAEKIIGLI